MHQILRWWYYPGTWFHPRLHTYSSLLISFKQCRLGRRSRFVDWVKCVLYITFHRKTWISPYQTINKRLINSTWQNCVCVWLVWDTCMLHCVCIYIYESWLGRQEWNEYWVICETVLLGLSILHKRIFMQSLLVESLKCGDPPKQYYSNNCDNQNVCEWSSFYCISPGILSAKRGHFEALPAVI